MGIICVNKLEAAKTSRWSASFQQFPHLSDCLKHNQTICPGLGVE